MYELKKLFVIPLLLLYITAMSGVMISLHYCGQEVESWSLYTDDDGCSDDGCGDESEDNDGCCKDEVIVVKVSEDQDAVAQFVLKVLAFDYQAVLPYPSFDLHKATLDNSVSLTAMPHAPPGEWQEIPLYILYSNYTYYG